MSTLPSIETIILQLRMGLGLERHPSKIHDKLVNGSRSIANYHEDLEKIFEEFQLELGLAPHAHEVLLGNLVEVASAYKRLELSTWTFDASDRQIIWHVAGYFFAPRIARIAAYWNLDGTLEKGMPGGRFWYLPVPKDGEQKSTLDLPVAQVIDWLEDLLGQSWEEYASILDSATNDGSVDSAEKIARTLHNWRRGTTPNVKKIREYFPDNIEVSFRGAFRPSAGLTQQEQFEESLSFLKRKKISVDELCRQIPLTDECKMEELLNGQASEEEKSNLLRMLSDRYSAPSMQTIRKRLIFARMVQDGYQKLLRNLCPGVSLTSTDPKQNKVRQLIWLFTTVHNLTIRAFQIHGQAHKDTQSIEDAWFEEQLPPWHKYGVFLSILPSERATSIEQLGLLLSRQFEQLRADDDLEGLIVTDESAPEEILARNFTRQKELEAELNAQSCLSDKLKQSSPWRTLQGETRFSILKQCAGDPNLPSPAKDAIIKRMHEAASTGSEQIQAAMAELSQHLYGHQKKRSKTTCARVQELLHACENNEDYALWDAPLLRFKAKHFIALNDFDSASRSYMEALEACKRRNFGPLRGQVAEELFSTMIANQKLTPSHHEQYYREMWAWGRLNTPDPAIEDIAKELFEGFWSILYQPYPGLVAERPRSEKDAVKLIQELLPLIMKEDKTDLRVWIKKNTKILRSKLPYVTGDSILMAMIKWRTQIKNVTPGQLMRRLASKHNDWSEQLGNFDALLENWRNGIEILIENTTPGLLNMVDFKGQSPLMLMAEAGDTELVQALLKQGADPDLQDFQGNTALHTSVKSFAGGCIDALLALDCCAEKSTIHGQTPLHLASEFGNTQAVKRLIDYAPHLQQACNALGETPLDLVQGIIESPNKYRVLTDLQTLHGRRVTTMRQLQEALRLLKAEHAIQ